MVEGDVAEGWIIDVGRDGGGAVGRTQHTGNQTRALDGGKLVAQLARQLGAGFVQLADKVSQPVIFLAGEVGIEGIGFDEIHPGVQILTADVLNDLRLGQGQKVVVAFQLRRMIAETSAAEILFAQPKALDHHTPGAIQQQKPLGGFLLNPGNAGITIQTHDKSLGTIPRIRQAA